MCETPKIGARYQGTVKSVRDFGAFVEILPGVEGLVHISELAAHHVENPREVVSQGDPVNVLILEIDGERRRLSLSLKRVEEDAVPVPRADGAESVHTTPDLKLSEEAFPAGGAVAAAEEDAEETAETEDEGPADEAEAEETEPVAEETEPVAEEPEPEAVDAEPAAEADAEAPADEPEAEETS
jgi:small subunit ribosomal protein S1